MKRLAFHMALIFTLMTTWAVAQEESKTQKVTPAKQSEKSAEAKAQAPKATPAKAESTETKSSETSATEKPVEPKIGKDGLYQIEKNIVEYTNSERVRRGLKPLQIDKKLVDSARGQAEWMTKTRRLEHTRKPVGENIAMGYNTSKSVVRGWMNSSGHRANILNSGYSRIGVAAYKSKDGTIWWCQQFLR